MIIVDTNVISELMRPQPDAAVSAWVDTHPAGELCTTAVTVAEVRYGLERLPAGRRQQELRRTADGIFAAFRERILPFDVSAAADYALIAADRDRSGQPINGFDAQIAAVCRVHGAPLATRNTKDFRDLGVALIDPWQFSAA
jgi:predicted nucleic acid-binding protein